MKRYSANNKMQSNIYVICCVLIVILTIIMCSTAVHGDYIPCMNAGNKTDYCNPTCTKCVDNVGCVPSSNEYCYIRNFCVKKNHLFTQHSTGKSVCQM